jgi:transposase
VVELARTGTRVAQLAETFGIAEATIYSWLKQDRIDRGEEPGLTTDGQMELASARRQIRQLETELAVSRKPLPGDRLPDRTGIRRADGLLDAGRRPFGLLRLEGAPSVREDAQARMACR